jgi:hypothetical protein
MLSRTCYLTWTYYVTEYGASSHDCAGRGDFEMSCAASSNAKVHVKRGLRFKETAMSKAKAFPYPPTELMPEMLRGTRMMFGCCR